MLVTKDVFLSRYPEMQPVADPGLIESVLSESEQDCPFDVWGDKQTRAIMLLSAHTLTLRWIQIGEVAGQAAALSQGQSGEAEMFGGTGRDNDLTLTQYGLQFLRLRSQLTSVAAQLLNGIYRPRVSIRPF